VTSPLAPATLEGWYALHQLYAADWTALGALDDEARAALRSQTRAMLAGLAEPAGGGWSGAYRLVGGGADLMLVHFRETLDQLAEAELQLRRAPVAGYLDLALDYLSVTEAGMYGATAQAAQEAKPGSKEFTKVLTEQVEAERATPHLQTRLYPRVPEGMRYVSFYPMSKRRAVQQNWYTLPLEERNRLMRDHGLTGRRYAGRVFQIITGSAGLDDWEWGVTLFARDPLEFKRIVTEMRYDEASSVYGEFGSFFTGIAQTPDEAADLLLRNDSSA
jgi:hydrogen peroxide-dependent heme synthase